MIDSALVQLPQPQTKSNGRESSSVSGGSTCECSVCVALHTCVLCGRCSYTDAQLRMCTMPSTLREAKQNRAGYSSRNIAMDGSAVEGLHCFMYVGAPHNLMP